MCNIIASHLRWFHVKNVQFIYFTYRAIKIAWRYIYYITDMQYILIMQAEYFSDQTLRT